MTNQEDRLREWRKLSEIPKRVSHYKNNKFGKLILKDFGYINKNGKNIGYWLCDCDCGNKDLLFWGSDIYRGRIVSCGCHKREINKERMTTHNMSRTRFYKIWESMIGRCYRKSHTSYKNYGAKGIKVCDRWHSFDNFYSDMYESFVMHSSIFGEDNTSLDRIENSIGYKLSNCRWSTWRTQFRNRSTNKYFIAISPEGSKFIHNAIIDFAEAHNLTKSNISDCLRGVQKSHKGWTFRYATYEEIEEHKSGR